MIPGGFQLLGFPPPNQATFDRKAGQIQTYVDHIRLDHRIGSAGHLIHSKRFSRSDLQTGLTQSSNNTGIIFS